MFWSGVLGLANVILQSFFTWQIALYSGKCKSGLCLPLINMLPERMESFLLYSPQYCFEGKELPQLAAMQLSREGDRSVDGAVPSKSLSNNAAVILGFT